MSSKKNIEVQLIAEPQKRQDTPLNVFIKGLALEDKKEFLNEVLGTNIIFSGTDKERNRKRFDNWRYTKPEATPSEVSMILLYIIANKYQKVELIELFPSIDQRYEILISGMVEYYHKYQSIRYTHKLKSLQHVFTKIEKPAIAREPAFVNYGGEKCKQKTIGIQNHD